MTHQRLLNRQIVVSKITSVSRDVVDAWINTVKATMENWPEERPYLAIHDLTSDRVSLTPYARTRAEELIPLGAKVPGYAGIVLPKSFVAQLIRLFMRTQRKQGVHNEIFFSMEEATNWLKSWIGTLRT
ncbi:MAG: hypothetical protein ABI947_19900 [Chloroflexota bacterium]